MSIAENPLLGPMRKSMGNFIISSYNGMTIIRSKPFKIRDAKTEKQLNMRARMTGIAKIYRAFGKVTGLGFPENSVGKSPQNMFVSANITTAFELVDAKPVISYPLLLLSKGSLPAVKVVEVVANVEGITVKYDTDLSSDEVFATDEIIACALLKSGALLLTRQIRGYHAYGTILLKHSSQETEEVACCYVFSRDIHGMKASNSVYVEVK